MTSNNELADDSACNTVKRPTGFTLIELMIVIAIIAIILTLALPVYTNYTIRAKIGEALAVAAATKTAVASTCHEDLTLTGIDNETVGYTFSPSTWIQNIVVTGDCVQPIITVNTQNTGAPGDPVITLTGSFASNDGAVTWFCTSTAESYHLPSTCRS
ncbi:pilin [Elongatibacter sediminis]|uniref:Pilin n=1 Tax=Elongatibacter sediminis TaxID=3119006 RepID=A0AAW9RKU3_9GAMM